MGMQQTLVGTRVRQRRGSMYSAVSKTLAAWSKQDHLAGDDSAAVRASLLAQARCVDRLEADDRNAAAAQAAAVLHNQLLQLRPTSTVDAFDEFVSSLTAT